MRIRIQLPRIYRPPVYQGKRLPENYFEGWYFKLVDQEKRHIWSVIPGVSFSSDSHSFIQVIHANTGSSHYVRFPIEAFSYKRSEFFVKIGLNEFSDRGISLNIDHTGLDVKGDLQFENTMPFPSGILSPGIMGWYSFVPFMECYHGVVSMHHDLAGSIGINGKTISFHHGKGYIEKDWGSSMPSDWIWIQSNHFDNDEKASFMLSLARIPWLNGFFPGFISFLHVKGKVYRFATYNRSVVSHLEVKGEVVRIKLKNRSHLLEIEVLRKDGVILKAPRHGSMDREIKESILSTVSLELKERNGKLLFSGSGRFAGLEIVGNMEQYFQNID